MPQPFCCGGQKNPHKIQGLALLGPCTDQFHSKLSVERVFKCPPWVEDPLAGGDGVTFGSGPGRK